MRLLRRNTTKTYTANKIKTSEILDENGYRTGSFQQEYDTPREIRATYSTTNGAHVREVFGDLANYSFLMLCEEKLEIGQRVWVNIFPTEEPNYEVVASNESLNVKAYALRSLSIV